MRKRQARLYLIAGQVQGVGYRFFAVSAAQRLNVSGWVRNLADGGVEVYACGTAEQLDEFEGWLRKGPRFADVRGVAVSDAAVTETSEFYIRS